MYKPDSQHPECVQLSYYLRPYFLTDTTGNHIHSGRIAKGDGSRDTIAGGWGDLIRSGNVIDAAGAHSHSVWIGSHNHSFSGITSSTGGDSSINITN